jgi:hypothetical protein
MPRPNNMVANQNARFHLSEIISHQTKGVSAENSQFRFSIKLMALALPAMFAPLLNKPDTKPQVKPTSLRRRCPKRE